MPPEKQTPIHIQLQDLMRIKLILRHDLSVALGGWDDDVRVVLEPTIIWRKMVRKRMMSVSEGEEADSAHNGNMRKRMREEESPESVDESSEEEVVGSNKRRKTVYDGVAGRLKNHEGQGRDEWRDDVNPNRKLLAPDDYLLRLPNAPEEGIPVEYHPDLPSSDLLKAVHLYAAEYYKERGLWQGYRSMDETALIGVGILLEEYLHDLLGPNGCEFYAMAKDTEDEEERQEEDNEGEPQSQNNTQDTSQDHADGQSQETTVNDVESP
jgi:hypothetical protein